MKRPDLVQLIFIIAGICSAFFCLDLAPRFLYFLFAWVYTGFVGGYIMEDFILTILLLATYLIFSIYSIRNSKQLSNWICEKANLHGEIHLALRTRNLLFAFFIILAVYGLIRDLPWLLVDSFNYLKSFNNSLEEGSAAYTGNKGDLVTQFIKVALMVILLVYANVFAGFFAARVKNPEPPDEIMK